jgi:hypothetical protein
LIQGDNVTAFYIGLLIVGAVCSFGLVFLYIRTQRGWWKHPIGKILVSLALVDGVFYAWYILVTLWPQIPGRSLVRLVLFTLMTIAIVYRFIAFLKLQPVMRRDKEIRESGAQPPVGS